MLCIFEILQRGCSYNCSCLSRGPVLNSSPILPGQLTYCGVTATGPFFNKEGIKQINWPNKQISVKKRKKKQSLEVDFIFLPQNYLFRVILSVFCDTKIAPISRNVDIFIKCTAKKFGEKAKKGRKPYKRTVQGHKWTIHTY